MTVPLTVDPATHASQIQAHNSMHFLTEYVDERCCYIFSGSFLWFCSYTVGLSFILKPTIFIASKKTNDNLIIFNFYQCSVVKQD
jgi:hypothetical protein